MGTASRDTRPRQAHGLLSTQGLLVCSPQEPQRVDTREQSFGREWEATVLTFIRIAPVASGHETFLV